MSKAHPADHRAKSGMSQAAAATRAGVSPGSAMRIEAGGGVNADTIVLYALAVGADPVRMFASWLRKSPRWSRRNSTKAAS